MKRLFTLLLAATLMLGLCACGAEAVIPTEEPTEPTAAIETLTMGQTLQVEGLEITLVTLETADSYTFRHQEKEGNTTVTTTSQIPHLDGKKILCLQIKIVNNTADAVVGEEKPIDAVITVNGTDLEATVFFCNEERSKRLDAVAPQQTAYCYIFTRVDVDKTIDTCQVRLGVLPGLANTEGAEDSAFTTFYVLEALPQE